MPASGVNDTHCPTHGFRWFVVSERPGQPFAPQRLACIRCEIERADRERERAAMICERYAQAMIVARAKMEDGKTPQAFAETEALGLIAAAKDIREIP